MRSSQNSTASESGKDVSQRLNIMIQVANALHYLHRGSSTPVVHCDLKPSNILLDQDLDARVSDFGVAKLLSHEESIVYTETVATLGYVAPEYGFEGQVSTKCDIYSFGIILMEVFTRRKPSDEMFNGDLSLRNWVSGYMRNGLIISAIDSNLLRSFEEQLAEVQVDCISLIMEVALDCTTDSPRDRKSIEEVLSTLHKIESQLSSCFNRRAA